MKKIATVEIYIEGDNASMKHFMDADTRQEQIIAATYIARALLDVCEGMDQKEAGKLAIRSLMVASAIEKEKMKETLPC